MRQVLKKGVLTMKRITSVTVFAGCLVLGLFGCAESAKTTAKQETTIATPGGKTTITTEKQVEKTGENPPATAP